MSGEQGAFRPTQKENDMRYHPMRTAGILGILCLVLAVLVALPSHAAAGPKDPTRSVCYYNGQSYSEGSERTDSNGKVFRCTSGEWQHVATVDKVQNDSSTWESGPVDLPGGSLDLPIGPAADPATDAAWTNPVTVESSPWLPEVVADPGAGQSVFAP